MTYLGRDQHYYKIANGTHWRHRDAAYNFRQGVCHHHHPSPYHTIPYYHYVITSPHHPLHQLSSAQQSPTRAPSKVDEAL
jgi:hypothetical protein